MRDLRERTKRFALDIIRFCATLPAGQEFRIVSGQLIRAGTSVGANYRAVCRARSKPDFINKLSVVEEEADESGYWLELLQCLLEPNAELLRLKNEASELTAIMVQSKKTARANERSPRPHSTFETRNSKFV